MTSSNREQLLKRYRQLKREFLKTHPKSAAYLKKSGWDLVDLGKASQQLLVAITLATQIATSKPQIKNPEPTAITITQDQESLESKVKSQQQFIKKLDEITKAGVGYLPGDKVSEIEQNLTQILGFKVSESLEGQKLNHSVGIMGGEQHLHRYLGDTLASHDAYQEAGIAPARGAFGWFTETGTLTPQDIMREKYYFAVQTLYLPTWNRDWSTLKPWYKFRKMIVINPAEQIAVVGVVGDAGPALWVGKQYGGSPEIIREGKIWSNKTRGKILLLFVDDPEDKVPLGPINLNKKMMADLLETG